MVKHITELNMKRKIKYFDKYRVKMKITLTVKNFTLIFYIYIYIYIYKGFVWNRGNEEMNKK